MADNGIRRSERGAIAVLVALLMVMMLTIVSFATDLGGWYLQGRQQQGLADVSALNGLLAHDAETKAYVEVQGVSTWNGLSPGQKDEAERRAMQAALDAIVGHLESNGVAFSGPTDVPTGCCVAKPGFSTVTLTADDGTVLVVTRDPQDRMTAELSRQGTQYFSGVVRDAPTITRRSTAMLSNCGASCDIPIRLEPPFSGFAAAGSGDGFAPIVKDDDEIWTVNHHVRSSSEGEIVCMDRDTEALCSPSGLFGLGDYQTANRPVEYHDTTGYRLYFVVRDPNSGSGGGGGDDECDDDDDDDGCSGSAGGQSGVACFDLDTRAFCSTRAFRGLWDQTSQAFPQIVNATGPWHYADKLYVISQDGQLACVNTDADMTPCGTWNTSAYQHSQFPALDGTPRIINGEQHGSRIYFTHIVPTGTVFHCWDVATASPCSNWTVPKFVNSLTGRDDQRLTHFRYDALTHDPIGICVTDLDRDGNACFDLGGNGPISIAGLSTAVAVLDNTWAGDTFTWQGKRTFFAGGNSNKTGCWDWETGSSCGTIAHDPGVNPYGYAELGRDCLIGLGHGSIFFSFDPETLEVCVGSTVETTINPCTCVDGSGRWGEVELPTDMLDQLKSIIATIAEPDGTIVVSDLDLLAAEGHLDLSGVDPSVPHLDLTLHVESKVDADGNPVWTEPIDTSLSLRVQPTLVG